MNECPKCPQCGTQMVAERVYGAGRLCRCPECHYRVPHPKGPLGPRQEGIRKAFKVKGESHAS